jgi:hypothetical protein
MFRVLLMDGAATLGESSQRGSGAEGFVFLVLGGGLARHAAAFVPLSQNGAMIVTPVVSSANRACRAGALMLLRSI